MAQKSAFFYIFRRGYQSYFTLALLLLQDVFLCTTKLKAELQFRGT